MLDDPSQFLRLLAALGFVLALMGLLAFILKKIGIGGISAVPGTKKRLKIIEAMPLDARRRLVLIQRDNKQHLVILGANSETVVETDIEPIASTNEIS
jgi:flagellar protein FliO/FliZ